MTNPAPPATPSTKPTRELQLATFQKYYDLLNPEQRLAVDAIEGPVMTIAGAGTGKTQILAVRIAKILLETQIDPFNILCLTFTDAGVTAMRNRLIEIIGPTAYHVKVCTFHSFCNEIIKDNPDTFIFKQEGEQLDDLDRLELFQKIIDQLGVTSPIRPAGEPYTYLKDLSAQIQNLKKENIDPDTLDTRLQELEKLLTALKKNLQEIMEAKRTVDESLAATVNPDHLFPKLGLTTPSAFEQTHLDYLKHLYQTYLNSLGGNKRQDNSARVKLRDALKHLILDGLDELPKQKELARAYSLYQQSLAETGRYDYEDMIMMVVRALTTNEPLLRKYQELYQYILVDEYQDTNSSQNQTVDLLGNFFESPNIFVVGDDDQSIYRFQGASIENIIAFHNRYQGEIKLITLIRNYRSQQAILDASGAVVANNQTRIATHLPNISKNLQSHAPHLVTPLKLYKYSTEQTEIYGTAKQIQDLIAAGTDPAQIAILYHKHVEARELTELLLRLKIPFELKAGQDILEDLQVTKLLTLFQLIENPNNDETFSQALFLDFLGFNKLDVMRFSHYFYQSRLGISQHTWLTAISNDQVLQSSRLSNPTPFKKFAAQLIEWRELVANITLPEFFVQVLEESGFLKFQVEQKKQSRVEILNRLNSLYKEIKKQTRRDHTVTITRFLEQLKIRRTHDLRLIEEPLHIGKNAVQMMSAHGSKGLEFEYVFLIHCTSRSWDKAGRNDKLKLPPGLVKSIITDRKLELEEDNRRLFYVAMTRAKKELRLSLAKNRFENGKAREDIPTIYLNEIPGEFFKEIDTSPYEQDLPDYLDLLFQGKPTPDLTTQETAHFQNLASTYILSPTALNTYLTCPRKFFYQNLIRLPQAKRASAAMGTAIHKSLELFLNQYRLKKINPGKEFLLLHYQRALQKELLSEKDYKEKLEYGRAVISEYFDAHGELLSSDVTSEINFASHGVNLNGIPITGKIDKLAPDPMRPDTGLVVSDFKTGNADNGLQESREGGDYWRQLVFYKILCDNSPQFRKAHTGKQVTTSQIEFLEKSRRTGRHEIAAIQVTPAAIAEVTENINFVHQQIIGQQFEKIDRSDPCDRCPFKNLCWEN